MKELERAVTEARQALRALEAEIAEAARKAASEARAVFAARLHASKADLAAAERAVREAIDASAAHPWEGKRVYKDIHATDWRGVVLKPHRVKERLEGIVEVRRQGTPIPGNLGYSAPRLGEPFIRKVKKDGTPGSAIYTREKPEKWTLAPIETRSDETLQAAQPAGRERDQRLNLVSREGNMWDE